MKQDNMQITCLCVIVLQFIVDINKDGLESNSKDEHVFSVSHIEPVYIKQEEDCCTEILPQFDIRVSVSYTYILTLQK
jgi:hypothetical protein